MKDQKRSVTVEDLLHLKRGERPAEAYWAEFDRQLRAKQLAALVGKPPLWQRIRMSVPAWSRYQLPVGVAVAMAVAFFGLREPAAPALQFASASEPAVAPIISASSEPQLSTLSAASAIADRSDHSDRHKLLVEQPMEPVVDARSVAGRTAAAPRETTVGAGAGVISRSLPLWGGEVSDEAPSPSARFIAANLAAAQDSIAPTLLAEVRGFESRAMPARAAAVEPLQQITVPGEARRTNRFLTAMVAMPVTDTTVRSAERMASRISVDELYDQPHRFGTRRGGVNMKF